MSQRKTVAKKKPKEETVVDDSERNEDEQPKTMEQRLDETIAEIKDF